MCKFQFNHVIENFDTPMLASKKEMGNQELRAKVAVKDGDGTAKVVSVDERRWSWPIKLICRKEDKSNTSEL